MVLARCLLVASLIVPMVGCGGVKEEKITVPSTAIEASVRSTLEGYVKSGQVGSSLTSLESDINGIASTDSAKAESLKEKYLELQRATKPAEVKSTAEAMLKML
ncbi:hypothetical protein [Aureliella helgolandensis]|uniref:Uncharacterized protein n=1 Tax=Aureliella helgolandensis TaxID=2527968 RepID=A0A518G8B9_9BACT|nr:hypothetical protein [Aureliella helgolandensis]QDV24829.1 hypothetical protein Q31a_31510 [Aureliella helgolandensis]